MLDFGKSYSKGMGYCDTIILISSTMARILSRPFMETQWSANLDWMAYWFSAGVSLISWWCCCIIYPIHIIRFIASLTMMPSIIASLRILLASTYVGRISNRLRDLVVHNWHNVSGTSLILHGGGRNSYKFAS
jgi:hypothetical protein